MLAHTHTHLLSVTIPLISHSYPVLARITQAFLCHQWHALSRAPAALHGRQAFDKLQRPTEQEAPGFSTSNLGEIYGFLWEWRIYLIYLQFKTSDLNSVQRGEMMTIHWSFSGKLHKSVQRITINSDLGGSWSKQSPGTWGNVPKQHAATTCNQGTPRKWDQFLVETLPVNPRLPSSFFSILCGQADPKGLIF